jgi:hypothetical protein
MRALRQHLPAARTSTRTAFAAIALLTLVGCRNKNETVDTSAVDCEAPVANAGPDTSATLGGPVTLDASSSSMCADRADDAAYEWAFESVPTDSTIDNSALSDNLTNSASQPVFTPDVVGDYTLSLVINDGVDLSEPNYVVMTIVSGDQKPVADCGPDVSGVAFESAQLDGSASYDPEGAALEFTWTLSDLPACSALTPESIYNSAGPTPSVVPDCDGVFTVTVIVSDGVNYSDPDICTIDVAASNRAPIADAGDTLDLGGCAENPLPLDGHGSYDPDADPLTYEWSLHTAPAGSTTTDANFDDVTTANPLFAWDMSGIYTFQLQVNDGEVSSAPDLVTVSISDSGDNRSPIANAGESQVIEAEADCTSSSYVWECDDCSEQTVELDGSASRDPDGDSVGYTWTESTGEVTFSARYSAITDATVPVQAASYGVANTIVFDVTLAVEDCEDSDSDTTTINYSCTGEAP